MPFLEITHAYFRGAQVEAIESELQREPGAMLANERPRMQKVNANWPIYIEMWTSMLLVGLGLRCGLKADWAHGVGPALILIGGMGFLIDGFAERRARPYTAALEALAAEQHVELPTE